MPNMTAEQHGRNLVLTVEGCDPITVAPLAAIRGRVLTEAFIATSLQRATPAEGEAVFIESINPGNYAAMTGLAVDEFDHAGAYVRTHYSPDETAVVSHGSTMPGDARYLTRERHADEPYLEPPAIRQEECEALCLGAFYWQTVVGFDGVKTFIAEGGGQVGSLKALALLQTRLGLSGRPISSQQGSAFSTLLGTSTGTGDTASSSTTERLPAAKRSRLPKLGRRKG